MSTYSSWLIALLLFTQLLVDLFQLELSNCILFQIKCYYLGIETNLFTVVRKNAGFAELDVTVRSPLGQDLPLSVRSIGEETDLIELCPSLPGNYCFHITYGGDSIPGKIHSFSSLFIELLTLLVM